MTLFGYRYVVWQITGSLFMSEWLNRSSPSISSAQYGCLSSEVDTVVLST